MQEGFFPGVKFVGSDMTWDKDNDEKSSFISFPSGFESPSGHLNSEWPLKSSVKKVVYGFSALIFVCKSLKFFKKILNSGESYLKAGLLYIVVKNIFCVQILALLQLIHEKPGRYDFLEGVNFCKLD